MVVFPVPGAPPRTMINGSPSFSKDDRSLVSKWLRRHELGRQCIVGIPSCQASPRAALPRRLKGPRFESVAFDSHPGEII